jgi:alkanesulfonate monooxygenase SsuD/methylene tetrahydromethanopterin reductase-like flavin-dependent oxidoreductase (luciferase family)
VPARRRTAFVNFGLASDNMAQTEAAIAVGAAAAGRDPGEVEIWRIAALDCNADGEAARRKVGAILAFVAAGYILQGDLTARGVPAELHGAVAELRRRYSTRPGAADAALVDQLGLFDYLSRRFAIHDTPDQCREQVLAARGAGLERVMFSVSLAADPIATVELFGREVLPAIR